MTREGDALLEIFRTALEAVRGDRAVVRALAAECPEGVVDVLAVGKAACEMTLGAREALGERFGQARVTTKSGYARDVGAGVVFEAAHPVPDETSVAAASDALAFSASRTDRPLLVLLSGGASALWCAPAAGLTLDHLRATTDALLRGGVAIAEMNAVRKHLSRIKGGRLAAVAAPRALWCLAISDVEGDALDTIGSGPVSGDPTSFADARAVVRALDVPVAVRAFLDAGGRPGGAPETPGPGETSVVGVHARVVATLDHALAAAERAARHHDWTIERGPRLAGEARELAPTLAREPERAHAGGATRPHLLVSGGEATVTVRGDGRGGRAQELALALALEVCGRDVTALIAATDGSDGPTDVAGAVIDGKTAARIRQAGRDPEADLARNDSYTALDAVGALVSTGPTGTNVTDLALVLQRHAG